MIKVDYNTSTDRYNFPCHGWDFKDAEDTRYRISALTGKREYQNWIQFVRWLVCESTSVRNVWVNGQKVWNADLGWFITQDELFALGNSR